LALFICAPIFHPFLSINKKPKPSSCDPLFAGPIKTKTLEKREKAFAFAAVLFKNEI
jgi:hypothetical protein